ncbi:MATE family efflux transporter [Novosphingobium sp. ST904]|uniref:MATE family efflux transporter n=1 Tax=Novosphingobium sp. ST904 TaxID=1684385 RepID=UPI0006CCC2FD|nr:MATE family efflux transporter [Novosphingobium sp. ST904]KPH64794.1 cation transporter [Novosphingobium sp. ST904]TCM34533.1 MATE family multidrug resistance protein [Novosphingobium sp. ST904]
MTQPTTPHPTPPRKGQARLLWSIALPAMLTNVATALFGLADMWAIGRLGDAPAQGAVELGAKYMMGLLNVFNFLRTSTVALTAQGTGRADRQAQAETLTRAMAVAMGIGVLLVCLMPVAIPFGLDLLEARGPLRESAGDYIAIRYWAGPLWLGNCVLVGWLIGQRLVRHVLVVEIGANILHIALDLLLVLVAKWGVAGVATATLTSELFKFLVLAAIVLRRPEARTAFALARQRTTWRRGELARLFALNRDLFLRALLLTAVLLAFARAGAQAGPLTLAANGILFQLFMLATLLLDGFESAAQVLCGEALGARNRAGFAATVRSALLWGGVMGLALTLAYAVGGKALAAAFNTDPGVIAATAVYAPWLTLLPLLGVSAYVLDGVFVGAGWTRAMMGTMLAAMAGYALLLWLLHPLGNHGLWAAFTMFFVIRGLGQAAVLPRLARRSFSVS